jgi:hypothetical protein
MKRLKRFAFIFPSGSFDKVTRRMETRALKRRQLICESGGPSQRSYGGRHRFSCNVIHIQRKFQYAIDMMLRDWKLLRRFLLLRLFLRSEV